MGTPRKGYFNEDGKRIPSVTTILGRFKDSGALMHWAFKQGQEGKQHLYEDRDKAATCGTLAHEMIEVHVNGYDHLGLLKGVDEDIKVKALNAYHMAMDWMADSKIEIISKWQEIQMISEKYQYGGTPDAIGRNSKGELCLLDWKTSNGVYSDYGLQLAAYAQLWNENYPDEPLTGGFHICRFSKDHPDFSHHFYRELDIEWLQFELLRKAYAQDKAIAKRYR